MTIGGSGSLKSALLACSASGAGPLLWNVMRKGKAVIIGAALVALALLPDVCRSRHSSALVVALTLVGYTQKTNWLWASVRLTNKGRDTAVYEAWGSLALQDLCSGAHGSYCYA